MLTATLRPYQEPAVELFLRRGNMLLAGGTGVGKTVMAITCAEELLGIDDIDLCVIVCPAALKYQWAKAISQFTDIPSRKIRVDKEFITVPRAPYGIVIDGKAYQRQGVKYSAADDRKRQYAQVNENTDYVILGYDNVTDDSRWVRRLKPGLVIIDEATAIKNPAAQLTRMTKQVLDSEYKIAITATPIENNLEELFFILEWVDPEFLGRWDFFEKAYIVRDDNGMVIRYKKTDILFEKLKEIMYRKMPDDPDVAAFMPGVREDEWVVQLDEPTRTAYLQMACDLFIELKSMPGGGRFDPAAYYSGQQDENTKVGKAMAIHQAIEMLLDHPRLVQISGEKYQESKRLQAQGVTRKVWPGSKYAYEITASGVLDEVLAPGYVSPKLRLIAEKVNKILTQDPKAKVIIFTKFKPLLDMLQHLFSWGSVQYHGEMNVRAKEGAVAKYTRDPDCRIFLSSHAGAYGRDLYMANHLVNTDWAPSAGRKDQINGRHRRAASEFEHVEVHNVIVADTIELRNQGKLGFKSRIGAAVLDGKGADRHGGVDNDVVSLTAYLDSQVGDLVESMM